MDTLTVLSRTASSDFEVKLVDYGADDAWGADNVEVMHYIRADMPVNQWVTIDIPVADLVAGGLSTSANIGQIVLKPMGGATETTWTTCTSQRESERSRRWCFGMSQTLRLFLTWSRTRVRVRWLRLSPPLMGARCCNGCR